MNDIVFRNRLSKFHENILLQIDQPALNLFARDFYILSDTQEERLAYMTLVRDVLLLLDAQLEVSNRDSDEILRFETDLANVSIFAMISKKLLVLSLTFMFHFLIAN